MTHTETIRHPREVHGESGEPQRRPVMPIARVGVDYVFDEQFGKAFVSYLFPVNRTIILESGDVTWVEFLTPGMRMKLEDGSIATVTKTSPPQLFNAPPEKPDNNGLQTKRVLGTIKRIGFVCIDIMVGGQRITTTPGHQFFSVTRNAFVCTIELRPNELLRNDRGGTIPVQAVGRPRHGRVELYNIEVEDFHTFFVGTPGNAVMAHNGIEGLCNIVRPLGQQEASQLTENVLYRIRRTDARGRPFGTPRNQTVPTVAEFNPQVGEIRASAIEGARTGPRQAINPVQEASVRQLSNEELLRFRPDEPISAHIVAGGNFEITGGNHRLAEIARRIEAGELPADTVVRILFHD